MRRSSCILLTLFLIFLSLPFTAQAQGKQGQARLDSLLGEVPKMREDTNGVKLMNFVSGMYNDSDPDEGLKWAEKALALSQQIGYRQGEAAAYYHIGTNNDNKGLFPAELDANFKALHIYEEIRDKTAISSTLSSIGKVYYSLGNYPKALEWVFKALKIAEEGGNMQQMQRCYSGIGAVYDRQEKLSEALEYKLKSLRIAEELNDKRSINGALGNIGDTYAHLQQYNTALGCYFKALPIAAEIGDKQGIAINYGNTGSTYYLIAADSAAPKPDSLVPASRPANLAKAVEYLNKGIGACREVQLYAAIPGFSQYLSEALALQGNYKGALAAYKQSVAVKDSLYNTANSAMIANLETKRAVELKDKDIQIAKLAVAKKRNERIFYIAGIALLLVIMGIILYNFRRHERSRRRINELQDHKISLLDEAVKRRTEQLGSMRQTIATDFHDQTGNMLAAITRQAATLELKLLRQPEMLPIVRSIIANSNELYASSKDFLWNLNHDSDDPLILFQYISGYGQRFYNQFDIAFSSALSGDQQPHMQLQPFAGLNLIYIVKEVMSNVIKHSGADEVYLKMRWEATGQVTYALQDNGTWKAPDSNVAHYGLNNMERRSQQSGFSYKLTHGDDGTRIEVGLPLSSDVNIAPETKDDSQKTKEQVRNTANS